MTDEGLEVEFEEESEKTRSSKHGQSANAGLVVGIGVSDGGLNDLAAFFKKSQIAIIS